jgi:hypothetical protein
LLKVPKSQPVNHKTTLFLIPKSHIKGKLANDRMPVLSDTCRKICLDTSG